MKLSWQRFIVLNYLTYCLNLWTKLTWRYNCKCLTNWSKVEIFWRTFFLSGFSISESLYETPSILAPETSLGHSKWHCVLTEPRSCALLISKTQITKFCDRFSFALTISGCVWVDLNHLLVQVRTLGMNFRRVIESSFSNLRLILVW